MRLVRDRSMDSQLSVVDTLSLAFAAGADLSAAAPALLDITANAGPSAHQASAQQLLAKVIDAGDVDVDTLDGAQTVLPQLVGYQAEKLAHSIARARVQAGEWAQIAELIASPPAIAWGTIDVLTESFENGVDISEALPSVQRLVVSKTGVLADHALKLLRLVEAAATRVGKLSPLAQNNLRLLIVELRFEVSAFDNWFEYDVPNPHSPRRVMVEILRLGPGVSPALCALAREEDRELRYWTLDGLIALGPDASSEAKLLYESLLSDPDSGFLAASRLGLMDPDLFFERGLQLRATAVSTVSERLAVHGEADGWLRRIPTLGDEAAAVAALTGLLEAPLNDDLINVVRDAEASPSQRVRDLAKMLLGRP